MAEVEMEQDASHRVAAFGVGVEEDLINYESDIADKHDNETDIHWDPMPTGDDGTKDEAEMLLDTVLVDVEGTHDHVEDGAPMLDSKDAQEQYSLADDKDLLLVPAEAGDEAVPVEDAQQNGDGDEVDDETGVEAEYPKDLDDDQLDLFAANDQDTEVLEQPFDADVRSEDEAEDAHEIDYDMNDPDTNASPENQGDLSLAEDSHDVDDTTVSQTALPSKDDLSASQEHDFDVARNQVEEEEDDEKEITWEEGETTTISKNAAGNVEENDSSQAEEALSTDHEAHADGGDQNEEVQVSEDQNGEGNDRADHTEVGSDHHSFAVTGHTSGDESATSPRVQHDFTAAHSESEDQDFPAITVQYKGDEFPFFSGSSEGFFTEAAVLDDNMKSLMDGFRAELANEIASDEELVFQIDELGLEFSESSLNESLSGITLRQILEVFDLLVKNQDPDSSRVLYTYLFTRPSTSKRFESLIESATAGKGLDEVIHLFASPMPHGNRVVIEETHAEENYDEDLDTYESAEDTKESDEENIEEASNERATDEFEYEGGEAEADASALSDPDSKPQTLASHDDEEPDLALPLTTDTLMEAEESGQPDLEEASHTPNNADLNVSTEQDGGVTAVSEYEASQEAKVDDVQPVHEEIPADQVSSNGEIAHPIATDTSTTNTLEDDLAAGSSAADAELDFTADQEFAQDVLDEQDELAEIDWRHEADDADESSDGAQAASKRPRTDDEPGMDDEKDAKRLRS